MQLTKRQKEFLKALWEREGSKPGSNLWLLLYPLGPLYCWGLSHLLFVNSSDSVVLNLTEVYTWITLAFQTAVCPLFILVFFFILAKEDGSPETLDDLLLTRSNITTIKATKFGKILRNTHSILLLVTVTVLLAAIGWKICSVWYLITSVLMKFYVHFCISRAEKRLVVIDAEIKKELDATLHRRPVEDEEKERKLDL